MSNQLSDIYGAADFLKIPVATVRRRIKAGTFPVPDSYQHETDWWDIDTLDKYQKALKRKKSRAARKKRV